MNADMVRDMRPALDVPEENDDDIHFDFIRLARSIAGMVVMVDTPFVIAVDGEWGSGKTTLMKKIGKVIREESDDIVTVEFDAWKYERIDLFTSLMHCIKKETGNKGALAKTVTKLGADVVLRNTVGMNFKDAKSHFNMVRSNLETIESVARKAIPKKMVILIDELDRCETKNILDMLEGIKLFLMVEKIVVVIAVDMERIMEAWGSIYKDDPDAGASYVEKLFQLKLMLPYKLAHDLRGYIKSMAPSLRDDYVNYIMDVVPHNPRKIKLTLNYVYFIVSTMEGFAPTNGMSHMRFYALVAWFAVRDNHKKFADHIRRMPDEFIHLAWICYNYDNYITYQSYMRKMSGFDKSSETIQIRRYNKGVIFHGAIVTGSLLEAMEKYLMDPKIFNILKNFGEKLAAVVRIEKRGRTDETFEAAFRPMCMLFEDVINMNFTRNADNYE